MVYILLRDCEIQMTISDQWCIYWQKFQLILIYILPSQTYILFQELQIQYKDSYFVKIWVYILTDMYKTIFVRYSKKLRTFDEKNQFGQILCDEDRILMLRNLTSCKWSLPGLDINKILKIIHGNGRQTGYKIAVWNCGRGLFADWNQSKLNEIQQFIENKRPHCFGIIEADLFGPNSQTNRKKYTTAEIKEKLRIDGYSIELPTSWDVHGQARLICYISDEIKYSRKYLKDGYDHIPSITLLVGNGKATRTAVHYFYREWKNGVSGESDSASQILHLQQHLSQMEGLLKEDIQMVALGDANVCALHWNNQNFRHKTLSNEIQTFLLQESCYQIVNQYTRIQSVSGNIQYSCLDHALTNVPERCNKPEVFNRE